MPQAHTHPLEGEVILIRFQESDYSGEDETGLLFRIESGKLVTIRGSLQLPSYVEEWRGFFDVDERAVKILKKLAVTRVYSPHGKKEFFGIDLWNWQETFPNSELNAEGEVECWYQYGSYFASDTGFPDLLKENGIELFLFNLETEISESF